MRRNVTAAQFSPDGKWHLVFAAGQTAAPHVWSRSELANGQEHDDRRRQISAICAAPSWTSDGKKLLLHRRRSAAPAMASLNRTVTQLLRGALTPHREGARHRRESTAKSRRWRARNRSRARAVADGARAPAPHVQVKIVWGRHSTGGITQLTSMPGLGRSYVTPLTRQHAPTCLRRRAAGRDDTGGGTRVPACTPSTKTARASRASTPPRLTAGGRAAGAADAGRTRRRSTSRNGPRTAAASYFPQGRRHLHAPVAAGPRATDRRGGSRRGGGMAAAGARMADRSRSTETACRRRGAAPHSTCR